MAIKVGGTTVVDDSRNLTNVASATLSGTLTTVKIAETVVALGTVTTSASIDLSSGTVFTATLGGNCTFTVTNPTGVSSFTLIITNDATPSRTVAFAGSGATFKLPGGTVTRTVAASAIDVFFFFTPNGGTTYFGSIPMANLS